jgi:hypothetical protein
VNRGTGWTAVAVVAFAVAFCVSVLRDDDAPARPAGLEAPAIAAAPGLPSLHRVTPLPAPPAPPKPKRRRPAPRPATPVATPAPTPVATTAPAAPAPAPTPRETFDSSG